MKTPSMMKIISATLLFFSSAIAYCCDNPLGETVYTLQPGQTQTVQWDFNNCGYGISSWGVYLSQPRNKNGSAQSLPPNTPLKMTVINVTTGEVYTGSSFSVVFLNEECSGEVMLLSLTYSGKKPLSVMVGTAGNLGGPP
jgi:hypothetical protein